MKITKKIISEDKIQERIIQLAKEINKDYEGKELIILGILKGAFIAISDLAKNLNIDVSFEFMSISSYEGSESTGQIKIEKDLDVDIAGKNILIVEDIFDTGLTLSSLIDILESRNPNEIEIMCMFVKPVENKIPVYHPINFESKSGGNTGSQAITTSWTDSEKGAVTYTVVSPTSKIYVQWNCHFQVENDASNYRMMGSLRSSVDSYASNLSDSAHEGTAPLVVNYSSPAIYLWIQHVQPVTAFHAHGQPAGTTISYKMYFQGSGSVSVYSWDTWGTSPSESVTFMEVEQ